MRSLPDLGALGSSPSSSGDTRPREGTPKGINPPNSPALFLQI